MPPTPESRDDRPADPGAWPGLGRREAALVRAFGSHRGWHRWLPRLIPALFLLSAGVWLFASAAWMALLTPWIGSLALAAAGTYLARVVIVTARVSLEEAHRRGTLDIRAGRRVRSALLQALSMAAGTLLLGLGFLLLSLRIVANGAPLAVTGLLWALCLGGFLLSLFVGELVMRLVDVLEPDDRDE